MARSLASNRFLVRDFGTSLSFVQNNNSYVDISGLNNIITYSAITVSTWINFSNFTNNPRIVANSHTDSDGKGFQLVINNDFASGFFNVGTLFGGGSSPANWNQVLTFNRWYHYVGTYDGTTIIAYLNGVPVGSNIKSGAILASPFDVNIGRNPAYNGDYMQGLIDEVQIYSQALTATQVQELYYRGGFISGLGLQAYYKFDEGSGSTVNDSSGNGNTGTIIGATYSTSVVSKPRTLATNRRPFKKITPVLSTTGSPDKCSVTLFSSANNDITMGCWVMLKTVPGARSRIISNGRTDAFNGYALQVGAGGVVQIDISFSASVNSGFTLQPLVWYHVVCSRTSTLGSLWQIYINGNKKGGTSSNSPGTPTGSFTAAAGNTGAGNNEYLNCYMSDVRFYSRALSDTEVLQWSQGVSISSSNLLCQWLLNEGSGSSATDNSGNGNTGTITGATYSTNISDPARVLHP